LSNRTAIFISHATPEDNKFTIWLGAKLAAIGYEVWADVLKLRGGDDWQRKLEDALRNLACKVLLVANPASVNKQGVRNELQIASDTARALKDDAFIIPLRLEPFQAPFLIAQAQYIDFQHGWAQGLRDLLSVLEELAIPRVHNGGTEIWRELQLQDSRQLSETPELLTSNWIAVQKLPDRIYYHPDDQVLDHANTYPEIPYGAGTLAFCAAASNSSNDADNHPQTTKLLDQFLADGWTELGIQPYEARRLLTQLVNLALGNYLKLRGLSSFRMANRHEAFWVSQTVATGRIAFNWRHFTGSRQLQGKSLKRGVSWHFAVSPSFQTFPSRHVRMLSRLIFTKMDWNPLQVRAACISYVAPLPRVGEMLAGATCSSLSYIGCQMEARY
jgi:TIR domain